MHGFYLAEHTIVGCLDVSGMGCVECLGGISLILQSVSSSVHSRPEDTYYNMGGTLSPKHST